MIDEKIFSNPPKSFDIDICGICNLRCSFCPEGQKLNEQPLKFMSYPDLVDIFNALPKQLTNIGLTNWSEPFLNRDIVRIIQFAKKNRPEVKIWASSNGNAFQGDLATQTVLAGLDYLEITISGLTDEIYQKYHRHGKLERVFRAVEEITKAKQHYNLSKPQLTINYLLFPYNVIDEDSIRQVFSEKLSHQEQLKFIDGIRMVRGTILGSQKVFQQTKNRLAESDKLFKHTTHFKNLCLQLFLNPAIRADGALFPCCIMEYRDDLVMGNLHKNKFHEIWDSEKYKKFRESFLSGKNKICNTCYFTYSSLPQFHLKHFRIRFRTNLKLIIQRILKNIFLIDQNLLKSKFFRLWVYFRLTNKLKNI